jgi:quinol monooxygenase YgiN
MAYGYIGSMKAQPGRRSEVIAILTSGFDGLQAAGCLSYIVSESASDPDTIWVTEIWPTQDAHDASLELPETKAAIGRAGPMLAGDFTRQDLRVVAGLGLDESP